MPSDKVQPQYIQDNAALVTLCQQLSASPVLAIDTEFVRTRTLYPKLGLLQVCNGEQLALIDPITIDDLSPFWHLLQDENIVKVLHACSEDLEVFLQYAGCKPVNFIDSQIMMMFLGHGLSLGYAAMVKHFTDVELDKSESRTDWTKRPLSDKQLNYAAADVTYLFDIYPQLVTLLRESTWLEAAQQETQLLIERKFTPINASELYRNIKMSWRLNPMQLNILKHLASWRFEQAQKRDLPLGFVAKDTTLFALAQRNPISVGAMAGIEGIDLLDVRHKGKAMLRVLKTASEDDESLYPAKIIRLDEYPGYKQIFKKVKQFINDVSQSSGLSVESLASKKQINQFLSYYFKINGEGNSAYNVDVLTGWRSNLFGIRLLAFAENNFS